VLFCHVTSRVEADPYQGLLQEKGGRGFPYLAFLDAEGNVIAKQGDRSVEGFEKTLATITDFRALEKKAKAGDRAAGIDAVIAGMELGAYDADQAKEKLAKLGPIPKDKQAKIDGMLVNFEVDAMMAKVRTQQQAEEAGRKFAEMEKEGRVPTGRTAWNFYAVMLAAHEAAGDAEAYEKALGVFKSLVEGQPNAARMTKRFEDTLEKLKKAKG